MLLCQPWTLVQISNIIRGAPNKCVFGLDRVHTLLLHMSYSWCMAAAKIHIKILSHFFSHFADINIVDGVARGGGGVMVWAGVCYGQWTQVHFIDDILNAQRYRDEILRPIAAPFIHDHHLILQHDNAQPHVARICVNSWKLKTSQFLHGQHTHWTCHPLNKIGMLWIGIYDSVFQFPPISSYFVQPLKRSGPTFHRPQSTTSSTLCKGDVLHCARQMVVIPDADWFSDPPRPPNVASLRHTCEITCCLISILIYHTCEVGWIILAKEKGSLTQI